MGLDPIEVTPTEIGGEPWGNHTDSSVVHSSFIKGSGDRGGDSTIVVQREVKVRRKIQYGVEVFWSWTSVPRFGSKPALEITPQYGIPCTSVLSHSCAGCYRSPRRV